MKKRWHLAATGLPRLGFYIPSRNSALKERRHGNSNAFSRTCLADPLSAKMCLVGVKVYIAELNKLYPTQYRKFGDSLLVSLDEVLFEDGSTTRGDTVSRGLWD